MHNAAEKRLTHLQMLEAEAIHIIREVAAGFDNPCMFYSIGKDSTVMLHLARKAFYPGKVPFPLLHIDTTWEFAEMAQFRDRLAEELDLNVLVHINEEALELGVHPIESGSVKYNDQMKTVALKQALDKYGFDAALGGCPPRRRKVAGQRTGILGAHADAWMGPESSAAKVVDATALETLLERYPAQGWMVHSEAGVHKGLMDREQVGALL